MINNLKQFGPRSDRVIDLPKPLQKLIKRLPLQRFPKLLHAPSQIAPPPTDTSLPITMVVTLTDNAPLLTRIKVEPPDSSSSDTDTTDTTDAADNSSSCPSGRSTPVVTPPSPSGHSQQPPLPMDTVILVAKSKDGSKNSLVFRSLLRNRRAAPGRVEKIRIIKTG